MKNNIFIYILLLVSVQLFSQDNHINLFEKGAQYYQQGEYTNAIEQYKAILAHGKESSA